MFNTTVRLGSMVVVAFALASGSEAAPRCKLWPVSASGTGTIGVRATGAAVRNWDRKVRSKYGEEYATWRNARNPSRTCRGPSGQVTCTVRGRPCSAS